MADGTAVIFGGLLSVDHMKRLYQGLLNAIRPDHSELALPELTGAKVEAPTQATPRSESKKKQKKIFEVIFAFLFISVWIPLLVVVWERPLAISHS